MVFGFLQNFSKKPSNFLTLPQSFSLPFSYLTLIFWLFGRGECPVKSCVSWNQPVSGLFFISACDWSAENQSLFSLVHASNTFSLEPVWDCWHNFEGIAPFSWTNTTQYSSTLFASISHCFSKLTFMLAEC